MSEALIAILSNLDAEKSARLLAAVREVTSRAQAEWSVIPEIDEILALSQVKESVYGDWDISNAMFQLKSSPSVSAKLSGAPETPRGYKETGVASEEDIARLPDNLKRLCPVGLTVEQVGQIKDPRTRMAVSRALGASDGVRKPTLRTDVRDGEVAKYEDSRDSAALSPADRIARHRRNGGVK